ncbi:MAG: prolyl oligopeptidase family serine peptidase [Bacteroidetes bacterium]|nr:prolyl oligopeptidase family serine peptidase [Bacteroidota bacterium]
MKNEFKALFSSDTMITETLNLNYQLLNSGSLEKRPLIIFLHGAGERGSDNEKQLFMGVSDIIENSKLLGEDPILLVPQCPIGYQWVEVNWGDSSHTQPKEISRPLQIVMNLVDSLIQDLPIDLNRIYITGLSMGGFGTWDYVVRKPDLFAAAIPICGGADESTLKKIANVPLWVFHGSLDNIVLPIRSRNAVNELKKNGSNVLYTEYPDASHNCWTRTYKNKSVYEWLFKQRR